MSEATAAASNEETQQTIRPIVSDLATVSSKETMDSRDDKESTAEEKTSARKNRYTAPSAASRNANNNSNAFVNHRPPSAHYPPPSHYYAAYGQPPPHGHQQPPAYMMHAGGYHQPPPPHHPQYSMAAAQGRNPSMMHPHMQHPHHPPPHVHAHPYYAMPSNNNNNISAAPFGGGHNNNNKSTPPISAINASHSSSSLGKKRSMEQQSHVSGFMFGRTESKDSMQETLGGGEDAPMTTNMSMEDDKPSSSKPTKTHRRNLSQTSTTSSLSVGGYSFESYDGPRVGASEDQTMTDIHTNSPKRRKGGDQLLVDTSRPESSCSQSMGTESIVADASKLLPTSTSTASSAGQGNIFLSLSTSPINNDVDQTPVKKNTTERKRNDKDESSSSKGNSSIFKLNNQATQPTIETNLSDVSHPSEIPTPPASHGDLGSTSMELNRHLRNQSFTPLPHTGSSGASPSGAAFASAMGAPQLSWSIAGDTPSLGDLADWEDEHNGKGPKTEQKLRPGSATSLSSARHMTISPQDFQFWKEEQDLADVAMTGTTTPLPVFFEQGAGEGSENHGLIRFDPATSNKKNHQPDYEYSSSNAMINRSGGGLRSASSHNKHHFSHHSNIQVHHHHQQQHMAWSKHHDEHSKTPLGMPPTPMFGNNGEYREDGNFNLRSPMGNDRREGMDYGYPGYSHHPNGPHGHNERIRNLRGRMMPGMHMPPMPLHIPPPMSAHLPMTSPMGLGPKAGLWSPHHHGGMHHHHPSPHHHMGSPMNNMTQSKRKCVPLKPPIPSKFQGDIEGVKSAPVPEFTSLVNFPAHMSQKQSVNLPEGLRCCVMCGQACPCTAVTKTKKSTNKKGSDCSLGPHSSNGQDCMGDKNAGYAIIPTQNKGLCTLCDVNVWVIVTTGLEIKWCKGCKNFRPWAAFGEKGLATKCLRCRERQREKYALQKEEKEKSRIKLKK